MWYFKQWYNKLDWKTRAWLQDLQRAPSSHLWYLDWNYNQEEESKSRNIWRSGLRCEIKLFGPLGFELAVDWEDENTGLSLVEKSWWIQGIIDYRWKLKPDILLNWTRNIWSVKRGLRVGLKRSQCKM